MLAITSAAQVGSGLAAASSRPAIGRADAEPVETRAEAAVEQTAEAGTLVVAREEPALVLQGVAEGDVGDVVQQGADRHQLGDVVGDRHAVAAQRGDDAMRQRAGAEQVIEAGVQSAGVDVRRGAELLHPAQALHLGQVEHGRLERRQRGDRRARGRGSASRAS
ncbi:MAG: hypothetical protein U0802_13665 [Candidatus Binatia bacterium]